MKRIQCYSAEKYDNEGNGRISVKIDTHGLGPEEIDLEVKKIRKKFEIANREWRSNNKKNGNRVSSDPNLLLPKSKILDIMKPKSTYNIKLDENTGNTIFILGSAKMGKSTLLMDIYRKYYNKKNIISTLYSINSHIKLYKTGSKKLIRCCKFDKECIKLIKMKKRLNYKCENKYEFCEIFDDITDVRYSELVNQLILTYRNSNISTIMSLQYPNLLAKSARGSINNICFFGFNTDECIEVVIKSFLGSYFTKFGVLGLSEQIAFYRDLTSDHKFIYLHPASGTISLHRLNI